MLPTDSSSNRWFVHSLPVRHSPEHLPSSRKTTDSPLRPARLQEYDQSRCSVCPAYSRWTDCANLWYKYRLICSFGMMPTCNPVQKYTTLKCVTGMCVNFNIPFVFLRFSSILATFVMSTSSSDCIQSPDAWKLGLWDSPRPDDDEAFCFLFGIQWQPSKSDAPGSVTLEFLVAWIILAWVIECGVVQKPRCLFCPKLCTSQSPAPTIHMSMCFSHVF